MINKEYTEFDILKSLTSGFYFKYFEYPTVLSDWNTAPEAVYEVPKT